MGALHLRAQVIVDRDTPKERPVRIEPFSLSRLPLSVCRQIESMYGSDPSTGRRLTVADWNEGWLRSDATALTILAWLVLRQEQPNLTFAGVTVAYGDVDMFYVGECEYCHDLEAVAGEECPVRAALVAPEDRDKQPRGWDVHQFDPPEDPQPAAAVDAPADEVGSSSTEQPSDQPESKDSTTSDPLGSDDSHTTSTSGRGSGTKKGSASATS